MEVMRVFYPFQVMLTIFLCMSCLTGCISSGGRASETESSGTEPVEPQGSDTPVPSKGAALSDPQGPDRLVANTLPGDGQFLLAGLSAGFYDSEEEEARALDHAARQLAIYYGAVVVSQEYLSEQTGSTYAARKIEIRYDEELAVRLRNDCTTGLSLRGQDFFVARVSCKSSEAPVIPPVPLDRDEAGRPLWLIYPPRIEGYVTAVGSATARRNLAESWEQADREGMAGIAESLGSQIRSREAEIGKEGGGAFRAESYVISSERIRGMYVIDRWRSPDHRTYYSLVIKKND